MSGQSGFTAGKLSRPALPTATCGRPSAGPHPCPRSPGHIGSDHERNVVTQHKRRRKHLSVVQFCPAAPQSFLSASCGTHANTFVSYLVQVDGPAGPSVPVIVAPRVQLLSRARAQVFASENVWYHCESTVTVLSLRWSACFRPVYAECIHYLLRPTSSHHVQDGRCCPDSRSQ